MGRTVLEPILELLAPGFCRECGREEPGGDFAYCEECRRTIRWLARACPACGNPLAAEPALPSRSEPSPVCGYCADKDFRFDRVAAGGLYDGVLRSAILRYKFHGDRGVRPFLVEVALDAARRSWMYDHVRRADVLIPVPQHWTKSLWRGWNPVLELAEEVAAHLAPDLAPGRRLPARSLLRKAHWTAPQVDLSGKVRRKNLRRAFTVRRGAEVPQRAVVFDDVMTTGTTASECAAALKRAGVESVALLALARSPTEF